MAPIVTYLLLSVNGLLYLLLVALGGGGAAFLQQWGIVAVDVRAALAGTDPNPAAAVTLLTGFFLHATWVHLAKNMLYLWVLGRAVEQELGSARFFGVYLASGVVAGLAQVAATPNLNIPAVGASGAVAGVVASYLFSQPGVAAAALLPKYFYAHTRDLAVAGLLVLWTISEFLVGALTVSGTSLALPIGWWAHLGGFMAGSVLTIAAAWRPRRHLALSHADAVHVVGLGTSEAQPLETGVTRQ